MAEKKHTKKQSEIIAYLSICTSPASPTEIGEACGRSYSLASSWACSGLKVLISNGEVRRLDGGYYELT